MNAEFDKLCIERLKQGDESALKQLFDAYYMSLCIYSVQITDSLEVSEDLVQDVFISFWERKAYSLLSSDVRAYLFAAVRHLSLNYMRRERPYALYDIEESFFPVENPVEERTDDEILRLRQKLHTALKALSPQEYRVLQAIVFENKKYKEVAEEMGLSINSVKTYWARALKFLRSQSLLGILFYLYY